MDDESRCRKIHHLLRFSTPMAGPGRVQRSGVTQHKPLGSRQPAGSIFCCCSFPVGGNGAAVCSKWRIIMKYESSKMRTPLINAYLILIYCSVMTLPHGPVALPKRVAALAREGNH